MNYSFINLKLARLKNVMENPIMEILFSEAAFQSVVQ